MFWHGWANDELKAACEASIELEGCHIKEELRCLAEKFARLEGDWVEVQQPTLTGRALMESIAEANEH